MGGAPTPTWTSGFEPLHFRQASGFAIGCCQTPYIDYHQYRLLLTGAPAAVDHEGTAGDAGGFVAGEIEGNGGGDFLGLEHAAGQLRGGHFWWRAFSGSDIRRGAP